MQNDDIGLPDSFFLDRQPDNTGEEINWAIKSLQNCADQFNKCLLEQCTKRQPQKSATPERKRHHKDSTTKYNSNGVSYAAQLAKEKRLEEEEWLMRRTVAVIVRRLPLEQLQRHYFYTCHVNYFVQDGEEYMPAELAMAEFNLKEGLTALMCFLIKPGKLPLGSKFEAIQWAEKTHGIPVNWDQGETDFVILHRAVIKFLTRRRKNIPPLYTMPDNLNNNHSISAVKSALSAFCKEAGENFEMYRIYPLPNLFYELKEKCMTPKEMSRSLSWANDELVKDVFSHSKRVIGCPFHEEKDLALHCSKSTVKRWTFSICSSCVRSLGVRPVAGYHCPSEQIDDLS